MNKVERVLRREGGTDFGHSFNGTELLEDSVPCPESELYTQIPLSGNSRTHRLPLCRVPGRGAVEAVTSLYRAGLGLTTQFISQDYGFIHLSGKQVGAEDISGLQANPTGKTAWTPLANFPPGEKPQRTRTSLGPVQRTS